MKERDPAKSIYFSNITKGFVPKNPICSWLGRILFQDLSQLRALIFLIAIFIFLKLINMNRNISKLILQHILLVFNSYKINNKFM